MKKKLLLIALLALCASMAFAQEEISISTGVIGNGRYLGAKTYDGQLTIGVLGLDSSGNAVLKSNAGVVQRADGDANRLLTFDASSDAALTQTFGDGGTTATQILTISASTADADDDSSLILCGGGGTANTRGACITLPGEEVSGGGDITYSAGASDTHIFQVGGTTEATLSNDTLTFTGASFAFVPGATAIYFQNNANNATNLGIANAGAITIRSTLTSSATSDLGWSVVNSANQACNTTCTSACVIGMDAGASAFLACSDATADSCLCAGAS